jgi:oxalate decarboxylase
MTLNRRQVLGGAGIAGVSALGGAATDRVLSPHQSTLPPPPVQAGAAKTDPARFGNPRIPAELNTQTPHLFRLAAQEPKRFEGGELRQANEETFPILVGEEASITLVTLDKDGLREPHWHPAAWEVNFVIRGKARFTVLDLQGHTETFDAAAGDVFFGPQGSMHYFENIGDEELKVLIIFNTSAQEGDDDISVAQSISALPPYVLASIFGVPVEHFAQLKKIDKPPVITRKKI